jgi:hypothetical protein
MTLARLVVEMGHLLLKWPWVIVGGHVRIDFTAHTSGVVSFTACTVTDQHSLRSFTACTMTDQHSLRSFALRISCLLLCAVLFRAAIGQDLRLHQRLAKDFAALSFVLWIHVGPEPPTD